ncbi:MAG: hypothetical protein ACPL4E_04415 [Thermoproteota archaeon]
MRKAIVELGSFEDGLKLFDIYFMIAGLSIWGKAQFLDGLGTIAEKSKEAMESVIEWLSKLEEAELKDVITLGIISKISTLDENGLRNIAIALEDPRIAMELAGEYESLSKVLPKLRGANYYEFRDRRVGRGGHIYLGKEIEAGDYRIIAKVKIDGEIKTISWTKMRGAEENYYIDYIYVPKKLRDDLGICGGETVLTLQIVKYIPEFYFPRSFRDGIFVLDFTDEKLKIGGELVDSSRFDPDEMFRDTGKGLGITVETGIRSTIGTGSPLMLRLYEDGSISFVKRTVAGETVDNVDAISLKNTLEELSLKEGGVERVVRLKEGEILYLEMEVHGHKYIFPIKTLSYREAKDYKIYVDAEGGKTTALLTYLKIIFGCDAIDEIQRKMEAGELKLVATLEDETKVTTRGPRMEITNEGLDIVSIGFYSPKLEPRLTLEEAYNYLKRIGIKDELINKVVEEYIEFMGYSAEEVESRIGGDINYLGDYGEWILIEHDAPRVTGIKYRVYLNGKLRIADIVETDSVVEVKYWRSKESYEIWFENPVAFNDFVNDLRGDKYVMEKNGLRKVCLVFVRRF